LAIPPRLVPAAQHQLDPRRRAQRTAFSTETRARTRSSRSGSPAREARNALRQAVHGTRFGNQPSVRFVRPDSRLTKKPIHTRSEPAATARGRGWL
jgi:hypothetical protein